MIPPIDLSVFDDAINSVVAFDDAGRYLYANESARRLYGSDGIVGQVVGDFAADPTNGEIEEDWKSLRRGGVAVGETVLRTGDGRSVRIRFRASATHLPNMYLSVVSEAATHGARKGRASARAELFHSVFEYAPEALLLADDRRRYVYGNRMARSLLGVSKEALVTRRIDDLATPATQVQLQGLWKRFLEGGAMKGIFPILLANGIERNVLFRARAHVRPGRHLISFQVARNEPAPAPVELAQLGPAEPLTFREREILTLLARGSSAKGIAEAATLSAATVRAHVRNAMRKLGARTRSHAIALAIALGQIDP
jgi:PAS domain S-box-containing protein